MTEGERIERVYASLSLSLASDLPDWQSSRGSARRPAERLREKRKTKDGFLVSRTHTLTCTLRFDLTLLFHYLDPPLMNTHTQASS